MHQKLSHKFCPEFRFSIHDIALVKVCKNLLNYTVAQNVVFCHP